MVAYLLFVLILVAVIGFMIRGLYASMRRREALQAWAQSNGLEFHGPDNYRLPSHLPDFTCLHWGENQYAYNVMQGRFHGREFLGFDYHYTRSSSDGRQADDFYFSAVIFKSDVPLKPFFIRPKNVLDKIEETVGLEHIQFESAEFNRKFCVNALDKKWAYDVLHQRTMEFLLGQPMFTIQFDWNSVIVHRTNTFSTTFTVSDFAAAAAVICGILDRLPEYLIHQQREEIFGQNGTP